MGEGRLLGEGGSEACQEVASAQTPEGSEGGVPSVRRKRSWWEPSLRQGRAGGIPGRRKEEGWLSLNEGQTGGK